MARLNINFAAPTRAPSGRFLAWALLLAGACASGVAWLDWQEAIDARQAAEAALRARPVATTRTTPARSPSATLSPDTQQAAQRAQKALDRPWDSVLTGIESAMTGDVALLALEARGETRVLRLQGEARDMPALAKLVDRLRQQPSLQSAVLVSHEAQSEGAASWLRFAIDAQWEVSP